MAIGPEPPIIQRYSIACEGSGDMGFFRELCSASGVNTFHIDCAKGIEFSRYLEGLTQRTALTPLDTVLVVGDNNGHPEKSFQKIRDEIRKAQTRTDLAVPHSPFEFVARNRQSTGIVVMMIPYDEHRQPVAGCLESLLLN